MDSSQHTSPPGLQGGLTDYGDKEFSLFLRKAFIKGAGYSDDALDRPVVGIINTESGFNPCHGNVPQLIEAIKRGVMLSGGLPVAFPTISIHESFSQPTSMYLRNLMSMDTEEMISAQPLDAVVLIGGCDKTVPAQLMGAVSAKVPAIQLVTGSMLTGGHEGRRLGACTDCRFYWGKHRAGEVSEKEIWEINDKLVGSVGTCAVMGTASTMACLAEALGTTVPGAASPPAVTSDRTRIAEETGREAVRLAHAGLTLDQVITEKSIKNALTTLLAIGGSTNAIIHLAAIAGRLGYEIDLRKIDAISENTPVLVDLKPSGQNYMEDFHRAGGMQTLLRNLGSRIDQTALTVTGRTLGEELEDAPKMFEQDIIRREENAVYPKGGIVALFGNLAPNGSIIKRSAATSELLEHTGRAVVFEDSADMARRLDDENLDINPDDILVLRNIGPVGAPGMPEAGYVPIPRKLARRGVKDMVRISDGRMSGTAAGTVILHVSPESAVGGPLGLVRNGDTIALSVSERSLTLDVDEKELERRKEEWELANNEADERFSRGYKKLYVETVEQAHLGADFRFLQPKNRSKSALGDQI
ncbi:dihydroxy-acid dehydratase [Corynebacterium glyciniphilum]|uniref:dihydroxy-acid dehydratase n=1 Tax=Corynebacterium glyciniphilum TaxID=1404244 RepID=UPI0011AB5B67|nr:dihydroxy-acid dehydratase [Corynebacterium glyciniphilum]